MFEASRGSKAAPQQEEKSEERKVYVCKRCDVEITDSRALFCMRADSVEQVFPNPLGIMRVILTARAASSILVEGSSTADFTWFSGYSWRIASCASCRSHLGWLYEGAPHGGEPHTFYGLLKEALAER
jgi:hypothetical protein